MAREKSVAPGEATVSARVIDRSLSQGGGLRGAPMGTSTVIRGSPQVMCYYAFTSSFVRFGRGTQPVGTSPRYPSTRRTSTSVRRGNFICSHGPEKRRQLRSPLLSAAFAALAVVTAKPCSPSRAVTVENPTSPSQATYLLPGEDEFSRTKYGGQLEPEGTLLRVHPSLPYQQRAQAASEAFQPANTPQSNAANYPGSATKLPEWVSAGIQRTLSPSRASRITSVRPATLGLVGVGAFTSGSVFLRSVKRKSSRRTREDDDDQNRDVCSVVCMHVPFCVPDRALLLERLERIAQTARIDNAEGMAKASREAAAVLQSEEGLLEDSRNFAPCIEVCLAENIEWAEKRFSGHVEIEAHRVERIQKCQKNAADETGGEYGVVTLVVATTEGVDLACYDEEATLISRLKGALDRLSRLRAGQIAGLELLWMPGDMESRSMSRSQMAEAFPCLKVT